MKKSIKIATLGVAALGFAGAPVLGASAVDTLSVKDLLTVTVQSFCTYDSIVPVAAKIKPLIPIKVPQLTFWLLNNYSGYHCLANHKIQNQEEWEEITPIENVKNKH